MAHVVMEVAPAPAERLLETARKGVRQAFEEKRNLTEVDISLYPAPYQGPEGPLPLLTASVPKDRLEDFLKEGLKYERLWLNPSPGP
ncbi:MAG: polysaccharide deacetylase family protein, partial [Thermus sp.]